MPAANGTPIEAHHVLRTATCSRRRCDLTAGLGTRAKIPVRHDTSGPPRRYRCRTSTGLRCIRVLVLPMILAPLVASAHHSIFGRFDGADSGEIEGELVGVSWSNPHVTFTVAVTPSAGGERALWEVETTSLSNLRKFDIAPGFMQVGDRIRVGGLPSVRGRNEIYANNVLLPSGEEVLLGAGVAPRWSERTVSASARARATAGDGSRPDLGIFRVWSTAGGPMLLPETVNPRFDLMSYPLTARARAALASFDRLADSPIANCAPKGMPAIMEQPYPMEFVDRGDRIVIRLEEYDTERIVHLTDDSEAIEPEPSRLGHSLGRWEGRTLVVRTTAVNWGHFDTVGIPLTEAAELAERFTLAEDGSRLDYRMIVTDPGTFTEPVELDKYWLWIPGVTVEPYACRVR